MACTKILLAFGATVNARAREGATPLYASCDQGHARCVALLMEHDADPSIGASIDALGAPANSRASISRGEDETPLSVAKLKRRTDCVAALRTKPLPADRLRRNVQLLPFNQRAAGEPYPINALRIRAVAAVRTSHFMVCDVDLWPSASLAAELAALDDSWWSTRRLAMVVPAFQLEQHAASERNPKLPGSLEELRTCVAARRCAARTTACSSPRPRRRSRGSASSRASA